MDKWKVGAVGVARGGGLVHILADHPRVQITALCDFNPSTLEHLAGLFSVPDRQVYTQFHEFLDAEMDIVVIATPIEYHAEQSIDAMEAGKHVLCEQTAAYTIDDCARLVDTVRRTGQTYMMAENYCYFHYIQQWQDWVRRGRLGEIFYAEAEYVHEIQDLLVDSKTGRRLWRSRRPPIWYCAHSLGPVLMLMDDRVVKATGMNADRHMFPTETTAFLDMELGLFQTQKGAMIKILRSQVAHRHKQMVFFSLYGTKGFVENGREGGWGETVGRAFFLDEMSKEEGSQEIDCPTANPEAPPEAHKSGLGTSEYTMIRAFIDALDSGAPPPVDVVKAANYTIPGILAHESGMKGGVWLDVPQFEL